MVIVIRPHICRTVVSHFLRFFSALKSYDFVIPSLIHSLNLCMFVLLIRDLSHYLYLTRVKHFYAILQDFFEFSAVFLVFFLDVNQNSIKTG